MFIASNYWGGSMSVEDLRSFETENEAWSYILKKNGPAFRPSLVRVYEVFNDKKPRLCKYVKGK